MTKKMKTLRDTWKRRGLRRLQRELEWRNSKIDELIKIRDSLQRVIKRREKAVNETI